MYSFMGILAADVPEAYGGMGSDKATIMLVSERMAYSGSFAVTHEGTVLSNPVQRPGAQSQAAFLESGGITLDGDAFDVFIVVFLQDNPVSDFKPGRTRIQFMELGRTLFNRKPQPC